MTFRVLPEPLHPLGDLALRYVAREYGVVAARFKIEEEIAPEVGYRPTLYAKKPDHSFVAVEVSDSVLPPEIQVLILGCKNNVIPLKLWVAVPWGAVEGVRPADMHFLKENGVGLVELHQDGRARVLSGPPLALSLTGLRSIRYSDFPGRYREYLRDAYDAFVNGSPAKGCSLVYDEIEQLTRRIILRAAAKGFLRNQFNFDARTAAWATVLTFLKTHFDRAAAGCPQLSDALLNRILGMTEYRNESGHKPGSLKKLIERDRRLRTRFESAVDELDALIKASSPLRP